MIRIRRIERRTKNPLDDVPDLDLDPEVDAVHEADHDQNHVIEEENASEIGIETETKIANHVTKSAIIRTEREICLKIEVIETIRTKKRKEIIGIKSGTEIPKIKNEIATEIEIRKLKPKTKRKETLQKIKKRTLRNEIAKIRRIKMTRSEHPRIPQKIRNARRIVRSKTTKSAKARTKKKIKAAISKKNKKIARKKRRTRKI
jgi:hypothetical protein